MNPFSSTVSTLEASPEHIIYANARNTRQKAQRELLLTNRRFNRDEILVSVERDVEYQDPRHSIIFITRPGTILQAIVNLQRHIVQVFSECGVADSSLWITPAENLHMTLLDIVSCVPQTSVNDLLPRVDASAILAYVPQDSQCTLREPMLMADGTALALSFLPSGQRVDDSHLRLRSQLWDGCHENGTTPAMRYVSMSAHVTLVRFLESFIVDEQTMMRLLDNLQQLSRDGLDHWTITTDDIQCVYGQVYYGGGRNIH